MTPFVVGKHVHTKRTHVHAGVDLTVTINDIQIVDVIKVIVKTPSHN